VIWPEVDNLVLSVVLVGRFRVVDRVDGGEWFFAGMLARERDVIARVLVAGRYLLLERKLQKLVDDGCDVAPVRDSEGTVLYRISCCSS
jgi:hypothetical protein